MDPSEPMVFEVAEEELQAAGTKPGATRRIDKEQAITYLEQGGLLSILRSNLSGGPNAPRVWLWTDGSGKVNHTFIEERGVVGGEIVPAWALHEDKLFTPKLDAIRSFLGSFGLNPDESDRVIRSAGALP